MIPGLVSTIIPVYNRPTLLVEAVESVLAQTYKPIELLIVDDGSTDATPQVAESLVAKSPDIVRLIRQSNGGPGRARQTGLESSRGEFIQYLDSDDLLMPRKFDLQVSTLSVSPECGVVYGKTREYTVGQQPSQVPTRRTGKHIRTLFPSMLQLRWWCTSTPLYRRAVLDSVGPWTNLRNEEDWEYDCRIGALGVTLAHCEEFVSDKRYHAGEQLSRDGASDPLKLRDRAQAHRLIYGHARRGGVCSNAPEMRHFSRELFLLARQCGAAALGGEAKMLFALAQDAAGPRSGALDFRLYSAVAGVVGWTIAGRLAQRLDAVRETKLTR